jgi:hypothetical protein
MAGMRPLCREALLIHRAEYCTCWSVRVVNGPRMDTAIQAWAAQLFNSADGD